MIQASICTIGDEILIGQIVDTNSGHIAQALGAVGIRCTHMLSLPDDRTEIIGRLSEALSAHDIVISTGGLGPTKDDITKDALRELSGSSGYRKDERQEAVIHDILHSRGLEVLESNLAQAMVPDRCEVIVNHKGTAPVMVFRFDAQRFGHPATLYALPGVPFEAIGALDDVLADIRAHYALEDICHRTLMTYGMAESALAERIAPWEDALPEDMHLAYLPNPLTGVRLRLSVYGGTRSLQESRISGQIEALKPYLGSLLYSERDDTLEAAVGRLLKERGETLSAAESCTGGEIAHLITSVSGSSAYFLGSVTSYAAEVKCAVLGVPRETIDEKGIVSSEVAAAMAEGVRKLTGSTYALSTTGWAEGPGDSFEPGGTVWVGVAGPDGTRTHRYRYKNDRKRNIERFSASALNFLRLYILGAITD